MHWRHKDTQIAFTRLHTEGGLDALTFAIVIGLLLLGFSRFVAAAKAATAMQKRLPTRMMVGQGSTWF